MVFTASDICKIILAIIFPPLGVLLERGCGVDLLINIGLTLLGYIPGKQTLQHNDLMALTTRFIVGIIHALYIIFKY